MNKLFLQAVIWFGIVSTVLAADPISGNDYTLPGQISEKTSIGPHNTTRTMSSGVVVTSTADVTVLTGRAVFSVGTRIAAGAGLQIKLIPYFPSLAKALRSTVNNQYIDLKVAPVIGYGSSQVTYTWVAYDANGNKLTSMTINGNGTSLSNNIFAQIADTSNVYKVIVTATTPGGTYNYMTYYVQPTQLVDFTAKILDTSGWTMSLKCTVVGADRYSKPSSGFIVGIGHAPSKDNPDDEVWKGSFDSNGCFSSTYVPPSNRIGSVLYIQPFATLKSGLVIYGRVAIVDTSGATPIAIDVGNSVSSQTVPPCLNYLQYLVDRSIVDEADVIGPPPSEYDVPVISTSSTAVNIATRAISLQDFDPAVQINYPAQFRLPGSEQAVLDVGHTVLSTMAAALTAIKLSPALSDLAEDQNFSLDNMFSNSLLYHIYSFNYLGADFVENPLLVMPISRTDIRAYCSSGHGPILGNENLALQFNEPEVRIQFEQMSRTDISESNGNPIHVNGMKALIPYGDSVVNINQIKYMIGQTYRPVLVNVVYPERDSAFCDLYRNNQYVFVPEMPMLPLAMKKSMVIVGYDDGVSRFNFRQTPSRDGAWILRNNGTADDSMVYLSYSDAAIADFVFSRPCVFDVEYNSTDGLSAYQNQPYIYQHCNYGAIVQTGYDVQANAGNVLSTSVGSVYNVYHQPDSQADVGAAAARTVLLYVKGVRFTTETINTTLNLKISTSNAPLVPGTFRASPDLSNTINDEALTPRTFSMTGTHTWNLQHAVHLPTDANDYRAPLYFSIVCDFTTGVPTNSVRYAIQTGEVATLQDNIFGGLSLDSLNIYTLGAPNRANNDRLTILGGSFVRWTTQNGGVGPWYDTNRNFNNQPVEGRIHRLVDLKAITQEVYPLNQILERLKARELGTIRIGGTKSINRSAFRSMLPSNAVPYAGVSVTTTQPANNPQHDDLLDPSTAMIVYPEAGGDTAADDYEFEFPSKLGQVYYVTPFDDYGDFKIWGETITVTNNDSLPYVPATVSINNITVTPDTNAGDSILDVVKVDVSYQSPPSGTPVVDSVGVWFYPSNSDFDIPDEEKTSNPQQGTVYSDYFNVYAGATYGYFIPYIVVAGTWIFGNQVYAPFPPSSNN